MTETDNRLYRTIVEIELNLDNDIFTDSGLSEYDYIDQEFRWMEPSGIYLRSEIEIQGATT